MGETRGRRGEYQSSLKSRKRGKTEGKVDIKVWRGGGPWVRVCVFVVAATGGSTDACTGM